MNKLDSARKLLFRKFLLKKFLELKMPGEYVDLSNENEGTYLAHINLLKKINEKDREINMLRSDFGMAEEAIDKFCPFRLRKSALLWLENKRARLEKIPHD